MNKEQILEMKSAYEEKLKTTLAQTLGFEEEDVKANWSLEGTIIKLKRTINDQQMYYTLNATDANISITMQSFKLHKNIDGAIVAYEALPNSIDLNTLAALHQTINAILSSDPTAPIEAKEAHQ